MKSLDDNVAPIGGAPGEPDAHQADEQTGLPGLRTWRAVYLFVLGCFAIWVGLLVALSMIFS
jgi:hypothetical protein